MTHVKMAKSESLKLPNKINWEWGILLIAYRAAVGTDTRVVCAILQ